MGVMQCHATTGRRCNTMPEVSRSAGGVLRLDAARAAGRPRGQRGDLDWQPAANGAAIRPPFNGPWDPRRFPIRPDPVRNFVRRVVPHPSVLSGQPGLIGRFGRWMEGHPWLWALHRRSVARGVFVGLFIGVIPLPTQMFLAALLCVPLRANAAAAMAATWLTNPLTALPIWAGAWWFGSWFTVQDSAAPPLVNALDIPWTQPGLWLPSLLSWVESLGKPTLIGLPIMSLLLGTVGYIVTMLVWRRVITRAWRTRRQRRRAA